MISARGTVMYYDLTGVMKHLELISKAQMERVDEEIFTISISKVKKGA